VTATDERRDMKRKLTTIFCADVSGYSRMMGADEARTLAVLKEYREAIEGFIARHHGRVVSWSGDGLLAEFGSVVEAVQCAAEVQRELKARNSSRDEDLRMTFRIGINLGDVMADGDDIFGEGVNIAARLQQMAVPGGILVSSPVYEQVRGKLSMGFSALGNQSVKNIAGEVSVYAVTMDGVTPHGSGTATTVPPQRWRDDPVAASPAIPKRAGLFRRGLALVVDYMIVLFAVLAGALVLNTSVSPTIVRMDLDVPFIDYGDLVDRTAWKVVSTEKDDEAVITKSERVVTYDYLGFFTQTYRQTRTQGKVAIDKKRDPAGSGTSGTADPADPVDAADPADPVAPVPPGAAPGIPAPPPPVPPPPPGPGEAGASADSKTYSAGGLTVQIGPGSVDTSNGVRLSADGTVSTDDEAGTSITIDADKDDVFSLSFSHVSEQLLDASTGKDITRPSLDLISLVLLVLYFAIMEAGRRGSTIGKNAFDLVVTRDDGRTLSFATALVRNLIKVLTSFILPIAILVALFSKRRQGIHDRIAGTVVVSDGTPR
jgi:class 3 adenylate cyclase